MPLQKWSNEIWVCKMSDDPGFSDDMDLLASQYVAAVSSPHVVIDLAGVDLLNSTNISQMLRVRTLTADRSRKLRLAGPSNAVWTVLLTAGLDRVFNFSHDTSIALADLQLGG